jgi:hypothetical protein
MKGWWFEEAIESGVLVGEISVATVLTTRQESFMIGEKHTSMI